VAAANLLRACGIGAFATQVPAMQTCLLALQLMPHWPQLRSSTAVLVHAALQQN
jgi:hypothetical protein